MSRAGDLIDRRKRGRRAGTPRARARRKARQGATRVAWIALGFNLCLLGLGARLYQLQVVQHDQFAVQSASNYQRDEIVRALRGEIRTRDGVLLATNRLAVDLVYTGRRRPTDPEQAIPAWDKIVYLAGIGGDVLVNGQPREPNFERETETVLSRNIPQDKLAALYEYTVLVPSLELRERVERVYPQGKMAGHLLGYVQEATETQVKDDGYAPGDLVGRSGLEYSLQSTLQGKNGLRRREVTAGGKPQTERVIDPGTKGQDVTLTIDSLLQRTAERALREGLADVNAGRVKHGKPPEPYTRGAIIAIDPRTNEVLAMASSPAYDPNWFARVPSADPAAKNWAIDSTRPLAKLDAVTSNRVVQEYNPGSVFKIATTLMYVEKWGNFTLPCNPVYYYGRSAKRNWARFPLGMVDARLAISYSCNPWYYDSAVRAGPSDYAHQLKTRLTELGYNSPTGLELVGEKTGRLMVPEEYTNPQFPWFPGFALNMSIGQGDVDVTPAQVVSVMSTIINDGQKRPLTVLKAIGGKVQPRKPAVSVVRKGNTQVFQLVKEGMSGTTAGTRYGTAQHEIGPRLFPVRTGGKTGTAQNGLSQRNGLAYTHAWYEGYGPLGSPNFAVVAFFQNGGEGSGPALKAVKKMFAARWCVTLDDKGSALPLNTQQPCTGELDQMHQVYKTRAARAKAPAAKP
ncbi:penicillin-binding transpeptidase domain-containing protein [Deinococcus multiflagellatus]|uniref:beta-lactamase n=1 Tax=Deinococcus multiflagellatus TaxID=1656887 RepID=A0ABW1ZIG2_9DEIO|nr:penicillin-binding transpeptidase domain-containing protein [Deinococcus multiflagellatus]MBZ9712045.1 penicillin-binding protein [Deinococcus multiflagellatus]